MEEMTTEDVLRTIPHCRELASSLSSTCPLKHHRPTVPPFRTYFTPTPVDGFLYIHQAYPAQAVEAFPMPVLDSWLRGPGFKLVARIFNYSSYIYSSDELPKAALAAAITAIAASTPPDVPPPSCIPPPRNPPQNPSPSMLVTVHSAEIQSLLLYGRVWSSEWISFEILPVTPILPPSALFTIGPFPSTDTQPPKEFLTNAWKAPQNAQLIATALFREDELEITADDILGHLLLSLSVHPFPLLSDQCFGFVVHTSTWLSDIDHWAALKRALLSLDYSLPLPRDQIHLITLPYCSLCHSVDHCRAQCPFPRLPFWKGPLL